jgi:CRISPR-associated exonuclease Cas4
VTTDPVEKLKRTADGTAAEQFRVGGVDMQYQAVCRRECWFHRHGIEIDRENRHIRRGSRVDDDSFERSRERVTLDGMIAPDLLDDGRIVEIKPSSDGLDAGVRQQLQYYLWYFREVVGVDRDGVISYPSERRREPVELDDEDVASIESAIRDVYELSERSSPPPAERKPFCDACAYHDFCWV